MPPTQEKPTFEELGGLTGNLGILDDSNNITLPTTQNESVTDTTVEPPKQVEPREERIALSTERAVDTVAQARNTEKQIQPPVQEQEAEFTVRPQVEEDELETVLKDNDDFITLSKDGNTRTFRNPQTNRQSINELVSDGWQVASSQLSEEFDFSLAEEELELKKSRDTLDALYDEMDSFKITDAQLQDELSGIAGKWNTRISQMADVNERRKRGFETLGTRIGAQFTGGVKGGIFGGVISEEERQGISRIGQLEASKTAELQSAKDAARKNNWDVYVNKIKTAEESYNSQLKEIERLNKIDVERRKQFDETIGKASRESAILDLMTQGVTSPAQLANLLNFDESGNQIGGITLKEITETMDSLQTEDGKKEKFDIYQSALNMGAPEDVLRGILSANTVEEAFLGAGGYASKATGIIGEYNRYKLESEQAGISPVSFSEYQTIDANRKAKASTIGLPNNVVTQVDKLSSSFDSSPIVKQFNEVQNKSLTISQIVDSGNLSGAGDLALVFEFMKSLDPTSVVRESEYDTASKASNPFKRVAAKMGGYFQEGQILPQEVRDEFKRLSSLKMDVIRNQYNNLRSETARKIEIKTKQYEATPGADYLTNYDFNTADEVVKTEAEAERKIEDALVNQSIDESVYSSLLDQGLSSIEIVEYLNI